jgi:hypothetical protein
MFFCSWGGRGGTSELAVTCRDSGLAGLGFLELADRRIGTGQSRWFAWLKIRGPLARDFAGCKVHTGMVGFTAVAGP